MALRVALNRVRPQLGFLGALGSSMRSGGGGGGGGSVVEQKNYDYFHRLPSSSKHFCRHYFLPPPPPYETVESLAFVGVFRVSNPHSVLPFAEFAVKTHNEKREGGAHGDAIVRLVRVVRASWTPVAGRMYYITLEGIDVETGELNVYYAEVLHRPFEDLIQLSYWKLVDPSFSYHFHEKRYSRRLRKEREREHAVQQNDIMTDWLGNLESVDDKICIWISPVKKLDCVHSLTQSYRVGMLNTDGCPLTPSDNFIDLCPTVTHRTVPVFDIKTYEMVYEYAMFAVGTQHKNEDKRLHLEDVLWASKTKVNDGWVYRIVVEATNGKNKPDFYYAMVKACPMRPLELIKWHQIGECIRPDLKEFYRQALEKQTDLKELSPASTGAEILDQYYVNNYKAPVA